MENILNTVRMNVRLSEGSSLLEKILLYLYLEGNKSTKEISQETLLPLPVVSAIKKEFMKLGILQQMNGVMLTAQGLDFVNGTLGYQGIDQSAYRACLQGMNDFETFLGNQYFDFLQLFENRPQVDVTLDQSKSLPETVLRRAVLCLQNHALIGKNILCVGDDDFVSIGICYLLQRLFGKGFGNTRVTVLDIDDRILGYISEIASRSGFPINCHRINLKETLPSKFRGTQDCFFTDPPYTLPGMELFLSRGIESLKPESDLSIFFSFAHKPADFTLEMQNIFQRLGIVLSGIYPRFNRYEGASIIGNTSQMHVLKTSPKTAATIKSSFSDKLYTGEINLSLRVYQCISCREKVEVGMKKHYATIEELKKSGCPRCQSSEFNLLKREVIKNDSNDQGK